MGEGECEPIEPSKKGRHRKKHLYNTILHQMEFYFSDSNLSKDRYLSQLINKDPFIDLNVFLSFNKIRKLNCTPDDIRKAISKSDTIELSEDKEKICRKNPIIIKDNVEDCTIYVENIKADADHEWLSHFFSDFGKVVYVSIPKYKNKGNKGFAFVEFEKETDAQNALSYFENIGCKMPADTNPDELVSIKTFEGSHKNEDSQINDAQTDEKIIKKRKLSKQENMPEKKIKIDLTEEITNQDQALGDNLQKSEETENKKKKKHKKDKKKNYIRDLGLKILSKKDWKKLRNKYLDLQRKKMKEFKQYLQKQKSNIINVTTKEKSLKEENNEGDESNQNDSSTILEFVPGVIVKVNLPKSSSDVKKLKTDIKSLSPAIKYVDIPLPAGCEEVYVRFSDNENAKQFCETNSIGTKTILEGEKEKEYWLKIKNDRTIKISKNVKKQRGRDKLLKKAEKLRAQHLRFDEGQ